MPAPAKNPEDYAIVIGINHYRQFPPLLQSAEQDARRFAAWLIDPDGGGLDPFKIHLLTGDSFAHDNETAAPIEYKPNRFTIDGRLQLMRVDQRTRIGRRLYFYFSGHGVGVSRDDVAMLLANAQETRLRDCHAGLGGYRHWLSEAAAFDELVFILDCCRNRLNMQPPTLGPTFDPFTNDPAFQSVKLLTVFASLDGDASFEAPGTNGIIPGVAAFTDRRGLLTQAVMELLERKVVDSSGPITAVSLASWVQKRVKELADSAGLDQEAKVPDPPREMILVPGPTATAPLAHVIPQVTFIVTIKPGLNGPLELIRGSALDQRQEHDAAVSPWVFTGPRDDLYMIRHPASGRMLLSIRQDDIRGDVHAVTI